MLVILILKNQAFSESLNDALTICDIVLVFEGQFSDAGCWGLECCLELFQRGGTWEGIEKIKLLIILSTVWPKLLQQCTA
jgi:hypothetical protein